MSLAEMEATVIKLNDIEEIKQIQYRYTNSLIQNLWDDMIDCFADDAALDFIGHELVEGKSKIEWLFKEVVSKNHIGKEGVFLSHPVINVDGSKATGLWLQYIFYPFYRKYQNGQQAAAWVQGYMSNEYKKVNGTWKISLLKWRSRMRAEQPQLIGIEQAENPYRP